MKRLSLLALVMILLMSACSSSYQYVGKQSKGQKKWLRNNRISSCY